MKTKIYYFKTITISKFVAITILSNLSEILFVTNPEHTSFQNDEFHQLPKFQSISSSDIILIRTIEQCNAVAKELNHALIFGFDTESKPTFNKGEVSTGPHLIQLATLEKAYLFQVSPPILFFLKPILNNPKQLKVGFGLKNDIHLFRSKGIEIQNTFDLSKSFSSFGLTNTVGIKTAIALLYKQHLVKSKKISTSNWSKKNLDNEQIHYAATDAYAALLVFYALANRFLVPSQFIKWTVK